jgi:hypothetical protein
MSRLQRKTELLASVVVFLVLVLVGAAFWIGWSEGHRADRAELGQIQESEEKKEVAREAQKALCRAGDAESFDPALCEKWAEITQEPPPVVPEILGPSQDDIVEAFEEYCAAGNCKGADGQPPTPDEVAAAFARFCADGKCQGKDGKDGADAAPVEPPADGKDGRDGEDGINGQDAPPPTPEMMLEAVTAYCADGRCVGEKGAQGERGPPPSPDDIALAVTNYCADGRCVGPKGDKGDTGEPGADSTVPGAKGDTGDPGRGIASVVCDSPTPVTFTFTYTDGTSEATQCGGIPGPPADNGPPIEVPSP